MEGIGESAAILLKLAPQLYRKARLSDAGQELVLNSAQRAGAYLLERFAGEKNEVVYQLCLDRKGKFLACKKLGEGGIASADLDIRRLVENALLTGASAVILAHNHPSGVALPSADDVQTTRRIAAALSAVEINLIDHIVVAEGDFISMAQSGYRFDEYQLT